MIEVNPARWKVKPWAHQVAGVKHLVSHPYRALFDEQRLGKGKQTVDAACTLYDAGLLDCVIVVCPSAVRGVWDDPDPVLMGEIHRHSWVPYSAARFSTAKPKLYIPPPGTLHWIVTNYEYLRNHWKLLAKFASKRTTMLVLDESTYVKGRRSTQTKAVYDLAQECDRRILLTGTPYANNITDLWSQFNILDPSAIWNMRYVAFRAKYAVTGFWGKDQIVGMNKPAVEKLKKRLKPWVLRRERNQCFDMPDKLYTRLEIPLTGETWRVYEEMREQMVAWLETQASIAVHGAIRTLRLAQIATGFLGGLTPEDPPTEVGRDKLDAFLKWREANEGPLVVWCRFRAELERMLRTLPRSGGIWGGQTDKQRQEVINKFRSGELDTVVGQPQAARFGINLSVANRAVYMSNDYGLLNRMQSEDRTIDVQKKTDCLYLDFIATTPKGGQTMDHTILKALRNKEDLAAWTVKDWIASLRSEGKS